MAFAAKGAVIVAVDEDGPAAEAGLRAGDELLEVDGHRPQDLMDLLDRAAWGDVELTFRRGEEVLQTVLVKMEDEPLGLEFSDKLFNRVKTCRNKCVFCFMEQMPKKMRPSLYYRDDDYRLSSLHGNFITLTNLSDEEWQRIVEQRVSPLYISVHATDNELREFLLGSTRQARMDVMRAMRELAEHGISMHTQIVLMPGLNDGAQLEKSLSDLAGLYPAVESVAVVPVGLTRFRGHLVELEPVTAAMVPGIVAQVGRFQQECMERWGTPLAYLADEMYLIGGLPLPPHSHYQDYCQIENGIGMVRHWIVDFNRRKRHFPTRLQRRRRYLMVTGEYGGIIFPPLIDQLERRVENLEIRLCPVKNEFFGHLVKCAGLLAGRDIKSALEAEAGFLAQPGVRVIIPGVALKDAAVMGGSTEGVLLDDIPLQALADHFRVPFLEGGASCVEWLDLLLERGPVREYLPNQQNFVPLRVIEYPEHAPKPREERSCRLP